MGLDALIAANREEGGSCVGRILQYMACVLMAAPGPVQAQEKIIYRYDALGRLEKSYYETGPAVGMMASSSYDAAGNRTTYAEGNVMQTLGSDQSLFSPDGRFKLAMQGDGNLVLYFGATVLWVAPGTYGTSNTAVFQNDGNFVVYGPSGPRWASGIYAPGAKMVLQNDGNLVIYSMDSIAVWHTGTGGH
jgi:hypothetical protein